MEHKIKHLMYCPFTGLGLYGGFRGNRWLKNRIEVFKSFVVPSLLNQTNQNFVLWVSWRPQERHNKYVSELKQWLYKTKLEVVFTYDGLCFFDDKFPTEVATERLVRNLNKTTADLIDVVGEVDYVLMTIQPSDDIYTSTAVDTIQKALRKHQACGFTKGYIMNYLDKKVSNYDPKTNPPFYTIKFKKEDFIEAGKHIRYTALKQDVNQYPKGTPIPSHEYPPFALEYKPIDERGFLVGTHQNNISTYYNIPYRGAEVSQEVLKDFGIYDVPPIKLATDWKRLILSRLPHKIRRKLRYWIEEKIVNKIYATFNKS